LRCGESDPPGAACRAMRDIEQARRHRGRPPWRNPKGRALLPRGFVERLGRIPDTAFGRSPAHAAKSLGAGGYT
jgi:hypothetical protein